MPRWFQTSTPRLEALGRIGTGGVVTAVGSATAGIGTFTVTFSGTNVAKTNVALMTATSSLTGTSPTLAVATTTAGVNADGKILPKGTLDVALDTGLCIKTPAPRRIRCGSKSQTNKPNMAAKIALKKVWRTHQNELVEDGHEKAAQLVARRGEVVDHDQIRHLKGTDKFFADTDSKEGEEAARPEKEEKPKPWTNAQIQDYRNAREGDESTRSTLEKIQPTKEHRTPRLRKFARAVPVPRKPARSPRPRPPRSRHHGRRTGRCLPGVAGRER
jgi:hypothetical protein